MDSADLYLYVMLRSSPYPEIEAIYNICMNKPITHCTENSKQIFPEMKLRGLVPNVCIAFMCL
jgi:hypothetical protein